MNRLSISIVVILLLVLASTAALGKSIEERKWIRMESQNFTIHSVLSERNTRNLLKNLEAVRSLFLRGTDDQLQPTIPTVIFALGGSKDFRELGFESKNYAGLFMARLRENRVIIRDVRGMDEAEMIVHEYIHYLHANTLRLPFPKWYREGYAEYVSTSSISGERFRVGHIDRNRVAWLAKIDRFPIENIIDSSFFYTLEDSTDINKFYAQSWLLTHFLYNQEGGEGYVHESLARYVVALQNGASETVAFEEGFGMTLPQLDEALGKYRKRGAYDYNWFDAEPLVGEFAPESVRLSKEEISIELAELILSLEFERHERDEEQLAKAQMLYEVALANPATKARSEIGIAYLLELAGDEKTAENYLRSGASRATSDFYVQLNAAQFWLNRTFGGDHDSEDLATIAEPYLRRALEIDKTNPEVLYTAGQYMLATGDIEEGIRLFTAVATLAPAVQSLRWQLAQLLVATGRLDEALTYAHDYLLLSHGSAAQVGAARMLINSIEQVKAEQQELSN